MNVNVYLPDELGKRAKAAELPFSHLLQRAVAEELNRRRIMSSTLAGPTVYELNLEDDDGRDFVGRITGRRLVEGRSGIEVFLTADERVLVHDPAKSRVHEIDDPTGELPDWLDDADYIEAMNSLGQAPIIDL